MLRLGSQKLCVQGHELIFCRSFARSWQKIAEVLSEVCRRVLSSSIGWQNRCVRRVRLAKNADRTSQRRMASVRVQSWLTSARAMSSIGERG